MDVVAVNRDRGIWQLFARAVVGLVVAVALILTVLPASAHHTIAAKFDPDQSLTLTGYVTKVDWLNPHVHILIDVQDGPDFTSWAIELPSQVDLQNSGWDADTLAPGDSITVDGLVARVETGIEVELDEAGRLADIADVDRVAPFLPWARDLFSLRQANSMKDDPMFLFCKPPGGPRQFQLSQGVQFVQEQHRERIWVMIGGGNRNWRFIYLDGRDQDDPAQPDFGHRLYYGRAVAEWEGDTLVVDTKDFNEDFWFSNGGLPHTSELHLVERISRPDYNTLQYEVTIDDPGAYTRTWSSSWTLEWIPGEDLPIDLCQDNRP
jgi:hypothetical protein